MSEISATLVALKEVVESRNISQRRLAEEIGVTEASVSRWFTGQRQPSIENIEKMIGVLGLRLVVRGGEWRSGEPKPGHTTEYLVKDSTGIISTRLYHPGKGWGEPGRPPHKDVVAWARLPQ